MGVGEGVQLVGESRVGIGEGLLASGVYILSFASRSSFTPETHAHNPHSSKTMPARPIVVVGAGIIGLTTAVRILQSEAVQRSGAKVHVIAGHLPNDPLDARYASTIAGAHHLSFADDNDVRQSTWDKKSEPPNRVWS